MVNAVRGEIAAVLDGKTFTLCLTLGALASLETAMGARNLAELSQRFGTGELASSDLLKIMTAGLQGGGNPVCETDVAKMKVEGGVVGYVEIVARLLNATFTPLSDD